MELIVCARLSHASRPDRIGAFAERMRESRTAVTDGRKAQRVRANADSSRPVAGDDPDMDARWRLWGPYLAERAWGTVREDYSASGDAWRYVSHDSSRSYAYRWS